MTTTKKTTTEKNSEKFEEVRHQVRYGWGISRGQDSYGYNLCRLYIDGQIVRFATQCGGGYDMRGAALGRWLARTYPERLNALEIPHTTRNGEPVQEYYGLSYHDPNFDPGKAVIGEGCDDRTLGQGSEGKTVEQAEAAGESFGLERYQAFYKASSSFPTERHNVPSIDGACGESCVQTIARACNVQLIYTR